MDIWINIIVALASIVLIAISAKYAIGAISNYAKNTGISDYLIGFLVVSVGTSLPDLSTAIVGSIANQGAIVLGDVIGANILDVTLVLGITAIVAKKLKITGQVLSKTSLYVLPIVIVPLVLGFDGKLSNIDGIILLLVFCYYTYMTLKKEQSFGYVKKNVPFKLLWKDMVVFLGSITALLLSARWLLISSLQIANYFSIPPYIMGLVLVAFGTTTPELTIGILAVLKGAEHKQIMFGNILGAVVLTSTFVLGVAAILRPIVFDRNVFLSTGMFMVTAVYIGILFINKKEITWKEGIGLLLIYLTFLISEGLIL